MRKLLALAAITILTACASYTGMEGTERDPETGYFIAGCGFFDKYNPNMLRRTLDGRFPGGGGGGSTGVGTTIPGGDTDCGKW